MECAADFLDNNIGNRRILAMMMIFPYQTNLLSVENRGADLGKTRCGICSMDFSGLQDMRIEFNEHGNNFNWI